MNSEQYKDLSKKTLSDKFCLTTPGHFRTLHAAMGIATEVGELLEASEKVEMDAVNIKEELGDILWYIAIFEREFDLTYAVEDLGSIEAPDFLSNKPLKEVYASMAVYSSKLVDVFKKAAFYGSGLDYDEADVYVTVIYSYVKEVAAAIGTNLGEIRLTNIEKLKSRFGDKFSSERATDRDLEKERRILEGK